MVHGETEERVRIECIAPQIAEGYCPLQVILYGSNAWSGPTDDSDIPGDRRTRKASFCGSMSPRDLREWSWVNGGTMAKQEAKPAGKSVSDSGVDLTLIRKYLAMTPTERLRAWENATRLALELKKHAPRSSEHP
jgi:hypothetical protein